MRRLNLLTLVGMVLTVLWLVGAGFVSITQLRPCSGRGGWGCEARAEGARSAPDVLGLGRLGDAIVLVLMPPATAWTTFAHVRRFWSRRRR